MDLALETVVAEGIAPGVNSLKGDKMIKDMRKTVAPVMYLEKHRKLLVQDDCMTAIPANRLSHPIWVALMACKKPLTTVGPCSLKHELILGSL